MRGGDVGAESEPTPPTGEASGDRGSGGKDGGVACAPSSWAKAATSMSPGESSFRLLAALVSLGDETRLPMWAAAAAFTGLPTGAATWA